MMKSRALIWTGAILSLVGLLSIGLVFFVWTIDQNNAKRYVIRVLSLGFAIHLF